MSTTSVLSAAALCLLASACADSIPLEPTATAGLTRVSARASAAASSDQVTTVDSALSGIASQLGLAGDDRHVVMAEVMYDASDYSLAQSSTLIIANDRQRGFGAEWVPGDPRRGGRVGVNWSIVGFGGLPPFKYDPAVPGFIRPATSSEIVARIQEGMAAWDARSCANFPITQVQGTGAEDIIHGLWLPQSFFTANWGPAGAGILGVTLTSVFGTSPTNTTDIDGNGKQDIAQAIIVYNAGKVWSDNGPFGTTDLFSVIAHESGHAFGLNHFGKVFVTKKDQQVDANGNPVIFVEDIKYAPKALMNAVYVTGRGEIRGTDNSSFCQIWAGK